MEHHGLRCPVCRSPTDVVAGWVHVDEATLRVDPQCHSCLHCATRLFIELKDVELVGDEQIPIISLNLAL
jgi:hypothetical protein